MMILTTLEVADALMPLLFQSIDWDYKEPSTEKEHLENITTWISEDGDVEKIDVHYLKSKWCVWPGIYSFLFGDGYTGTWNSLRFSTTDHRIFKRLDLSFFTKLTLQVRPLRIQYKNGIGHANFLFGCAGKVYRLEPNTDPNSKAINRVLKRECEKQGLEFISLNGLHYLHTDEIKKYTSGGLCVIRSIILMRLIVHFNTVQVTEINRIIDFVNSLDNLCELFMRCMFGLTQIIQEEEKRREEEKYHFINSHIRKNIRKWRNDKVTEWIKDDFRDTKSGIELYKEMYGDDWFDELVRDRVAFRKNPRERRKSVKRMMWSIGAFKCSNRILERFHEDAEEAWNK